MSPNSAPRCRLARRLSAHFPEVIPMRSSNTDPTYLPAHQLAAEIAARRLSPVDIVEALLARIARARRQTARLHRCLRG